MKLTANNLMRLIIVVVQVAAVKIYVAAVDALLGKKGKRG